MDVCVVTYHNSAEAVATGLRPGDRLWVRDNTHDNIGFARAANELAAKGTDPLILFANPDGEPLPGCFDLLEAEFDDPGVVAASARSSPSQPEPVRDYLVGACLAVRRQAFESVGGFDDSFFMYAEDVDLSWKLASHGRLVLSERAVFVHRGNDAWTAHFRRVRNSLLLERRWQHHPRVGTLTRRGLALIRRGHLRQGSAHLAGVAHFVLANRSARSRDDAKGPG